MIPSRVSAKLSVDLDSHEVHEMIIRCYNQVYSPKLTLEELTAELEASVKIEVINQKESLLKGVDFFGLRVKKVSFQTTIHEADNLPEVISHEGDVFTLIAEIIFYDFVILGETNGYFLVTHDTESFYDKMVDIHYIPKESNIRFLKMQRI